MFEEIVIETDRLAFPALAAGEGPIVVCWHGFPDHPASFAPLAERLVAAGRRVVAPFLRGHHPMTAGQMKYGDGLTLAADGAAINAALSPEPVDMIGHDIGAGIVGRMASVWPERVRGAVTMSVPPPATLSRILATPAQQQRFFYLWMFQVPDVAEALLNADLLAYLWRQWSPGLDPGAHLTLIQEMYADPQIKANALKIYRSNFDRTQRDPALAEAARISEKAAPIPMLVLGGADDGCITPDGYADAATGLAPGSQVRIVADAGHFLQLDNPDEVAALALDWFAR